MKVFFLPYCASMWRSLAPLWQEHKDAGDDVSVIPIPYYGRDRSGALATYHWDICRYPVPVRQGVCISEEHPDIIYYHNPYDGDNTITSVEPTMYSGELKRVTDELIYAPYYTEGMGGDLESAVRAPGIDNADKIITWSEDQQKAYQYWHPDKEVVLKKRPALPPAEVPPEWERRINGRRVIFFGTSLSSLMRDPKSEIKKIDQVIRTTEDCLLWRPHPLFVDTINALFPQFGNQYMKCLQRFAQTEGIFDDSWDLERAAVIADEYLGDPSSVVKLFWDQNKPVRLI